MSETGRQVLSGFHCFFEHHLIEFVNFGVVVCSVSELEFRIEDFGRFFFVNMRRESRISISMSDEVKACADSNSTIFVKSVLFKE
jgi:hypothetical protein